MNDVSPQQLQDRIELAAMVAAFGTEGFSLQIGSVLTGLDNGVGQRMRTITISIDRPAGRDLIDATARELWSLMAHTSSVSYSLCIPAGLWQRVLIEVAAGELKAKRDARRAMRAAAHAAPWIPVAVAVETAQPHQQ